jgi:hypothetical protein
MCAVRVNFKGFIMAGYGLITSAKTGKAISFVVTGLGVTRVNFKDFIIAGYGLIKSAKPVKATSFVAPG